MLNKVLIITHGLFGIELKKSAEMIMGEQENVEALGLIPGQSVDELHAQALEIVKKNEADGFHTVVMVDLMGGSPSNVALMTCLKEVDWRRTRRCQHADADRCHLRPDLPGGLGACRERLRRGPEWYVADQSC